jgi:hypothetical protein
MLVFSLAYALTRLCLFTLRCAVGCGWTEQLVRLWVGEAFALAVV